MEGWEVQIGLSTKLGKRDSWSLFLSCAGRIPLKWDDLRASAGASSQGFVLVHRAYVVCYDVVECLVSQLLKRFHGFGRQQPKFLPGLVVQLHPFANHGVRLDWIIPAARSVCSASDYVSFSRDHLCDFHIFRPAGLFFKCSLVANGLWAPARAGRGGAHLAWRKRPLGGEIRQLMAAT